MHMLHHSESVGSGTQNRVSEVVVFAFNGDWYWYFSCAIRSARLCRGGMTGTGDDWLACDKFSFGSFVGYLTVVIGVIEQRIV